MPQSFVSLNYHLIFSTKGREPTLDEEVRERLFEYIGGILRAHGASLLASGGMPDHVHLLVMLHLQTSVAEAIRLMKTNSSKWVHETFPNLRHFAWQNGYGAFAVSASIVPQVERYIRHQQEHHRRRTFQEEFLKFLKRHGLPFDEHHLWD